MSKFKTFIGIDISKDTFDAACICPDTGAVTHECFKQNKTGFTTFIHWMKKQDARLEDTLICMEHTGLYTHGIIRFLVGLKANLWVEMAIKIKRSMGLRRGTDDKAAATTIAEYAMRFTDRARLWKTVDTNLSTLRDMITQRG